MYTVEAVVENKKIDFLDNFDVPEKPVKVLVTFLDKNVNNSNIEPLYWSNEVLGTKDHEDFISLLRKA